MIVSILSTRFLPVTAHHAEQCGKQEHFAGSARSNSALVVHGHPQDDPCDLLVARNNSKSIAQHFDPRKPTCDVPPSAIATSS